MDPLSSHSPEGWARPGGPAQNADPPAPKVLPLGHTPHCLWGGRTRRVSASAEATRGTLQDAFQSVFTPAVSSEANQDGSLSMSHQRTKEFRQSHLATTSSRDK